MATQLGTLKTGLSPCPMPRRNNSLVREPMYPVPGGQSMGDGNLVCIKNNMTVMVHWHGKFRGPEFAPLHFELQPGTTEKLKDSKGRLISTIIAAPLTENEAAETNETSRRNQNRCSPCCKTTTNSRWPKSPRNSAGTSRAANLIARWCIGPLQTLLDEKLVKKIRELTAFSHTLEKLLLFARRVTLGSAKIRFIVFIVRCGPVVDRRCEWRVGKTRSGV